ncbi:putative protein kinase RLK-Pelle-LRR-IX family [Helianthus annuus]|nr:putative protein kinase RLK-Pelle-LRR-IX family [Helianthus annuus]KAJ0467335.1 putative protein kinase RLK-Pelle-LRR-IX family [Helianthus annuus]KAJ0702689.1 putative protein kinase RLK-Pelle-LRR-IX family [Helianthus annuus]
MPQGELSRHLFLWKNFKLEPVSWERRFSIALDVARGMEYLHSLAHQSSIHRDLKSSNILLCDVSSQSFGFRTGETRPGWWEVNNDSGS